MRDVPIDDVEEQEVPVDQALAGARRDRDLLSSFVILPLAVPTAMVAPTDPEIVIEKASSCSIAVSATTTTGMVFDFSPG